VERAACDGHAGEVIGGDLDPALVGALVESSVKGLGQCWSWWLMR